MNYRSAIDLSQFPDSPYAQELRASAARLGFAPALEAAFRQLHLQRAHVRTRAWGLVMAFFALVFAIEKIRAEGPLHPISLLHYFTTPTALLVAWLPWSRFYQSHYLRIARIVSPIIFGLTAPFSARAIAEGQYEVPVLFALQMVGIFLFTGLLYRMALAACVAMMIGFAAGTVIWALPADLAFKYVAMMGLAAFLGAVAFRGAEVIARTQFLEGNLLGELLERDPLTGLKNRRLFDEHLQRVFLQAQRDHRAVAVMMIDVDDFKRYNDTYGHQAGDDALRRVGAALREFGCRPLDLVARYGGEEFALIMSDATIEHAGKVAEQLRTAVAALEIPHSAARAAPFVTLSVGVAVGEPVVGRTARGLVQLADEALYAAKAAGRNNVVLKGPEMYSAVNTGVFAALPEQSRDRTVG